MTEHNDKLLIREPKWREEDLGVPLPDSLHANSVCLPQWQDVVDYEEKNPRVIQRLQAGYPRFVVPPSCAKFFTECRRRFARDNELCHAYPTERTALRAAEFIKLWSGGGARVVPWGEGRVHAVFFPDSSETWALKYWRHVGEGISSRQAEALLSGHKDVHSVDGRQHLQERIAGLAGVPVDCVYLFKSGMAAIYALYRAVIRLQPEGTCVQFGFPYVDTLKIQQHFGHRSTFFPLGNANDLKMLTRLCVIDKIAGIFTEFPSNPLLNSPDLQTLSRMGRNYRIPLIVDDTISSWANVDLMPVADATVTSLTKYFAGRGDLMSGAAVLNPKSPLYPELRGALKAEFEDCTWGESILLMNEYAGDFLPRVKKINQTAELVCDWLKNRPEVKTVYYPKYQTPEIYNAFKRPDGGYSGLFSLLLHDAARTSPVFYNNLEFCKGPNLGTTFSLCCPFTLLAHFDELDWAEQCGVSRYLLRFSIGLEEPDELIARLERALKLIG